MSIEALLLQLEREADREAARMRGEAEERAARILDRADADARRRRTLHLEQAAGRLRADSERRVAASRAGAREEFLEARGAVLARVFDLATEALERMPVSRYADGLGPLATDALRFLERDAAVLQVPPEAVPVARAAIGGHAGSTIEAAEMPAGVVARSVDGRVTVDNTLAAILRRSQPDLAGRITAWIEEGGHAVG